MQRLLVICLGVTLFAAAVVSAADLKEGDM